MAHKMGEKCQNRLIKVCDTIKQDIHVAENRTLKRQIGTFCANLEVKRAEINTNEVDAFEYISALIEILRRLRTKHRQFENILPQ